MRSLGMSIKKTLMPIFMVSSLVGIMLFVLHWEFIPAGRAYGRKIFTEVKSKAILANITSGNFFTEIPDLLFFAEKVDPVTYQMENIFLYQEEEDLKDKVIFARTGHLVIPKNQSRENTHFKLWNGEILFRQPGNDKYEKLIFQQIDYALPPFDTYFDIAFKPSFISFPQLLSLNKKAKNLLDDEKIDHERFIDIRTEPWERLWTSVICLFFAGLGFLVGLGHFRQSNKLRSFYAFLILLVYFVSYYFLMGLAKKAKVEFYLPFLVSGILLSLMLAYWWRKSRWVLES